MNFGILGSLNAHQDEVTTRKALIHSVWEIYADFGSRSRDRYVVNLRDLFNDQGLDLKQFRTVRRGGPASMRSAFFNRDATPLPPAFKTAPAVRSVA